MSEPENSLRAIFAEALEIGEPHLRAAFLSRACGSNLELRRQVEELIQAEAAAPNFLPDLPSPTAARAGLLQAAGLLDPILAKDLSPLEKPRDRIGRYRLLEKIGEGGCGVVYAAEQVAPVRRRVALKVIKSGMDTRAVIARFEAERQALALMDHPNIAKVLDAGATETGRPYFVMELVRGIRITDYCDQNHLSTPQRLDLFAQICKAIQHAHQKGIIHRDIKPSNILVALHDGVPVPKIIDFGIAKATSDQRLTDKTLFTAFQQFIGTPAYMSPEQAEMSGQDIDTRSDIYSLGVLLYELLTGRTPFESKELLAAGLDEMRRTIREKEPPKPSTRLTQELAAADATMLSSKPDVDEASARRLLRVKELIPLVRGDLDWIVMKALEKDRARRYETANGLATDIQRHLDSEPVAACPPSNLYRFQKLFRRNQLVFGMAGVVTAALICGLGFSSWMFFKEQAARRHSESAEKTAQTEAAKSRQVAQFLKDMLAGVGPSVALGRDTKLLQEILDKTAERIGNDLTNQPEVEVELQATLGRVYQELGRYEKAELTYRKAVAIRRKLRRGDSPELALSLHDLALALFIQNKQVEAAAIARQALAMYKTVRGDQDPAVAISSDVLAGILWTGGEGAEAVTIEREVLARYKTLLGDEHCLVAEALDNLAAMLSTEGDLMEAETLAREGLAMRCKIFGNASPEMAVSLNLLANILAKEGGLVEAENLQREALAVRRKYYSNYHPLVVVSLGNLILVLERRGKLAEAETLARECLSICEQIFPDDWRTFNSRSLLGSSLLGQAKFADAETLLFSGYEGLKQRENRIPYDCKPRLKETVQDLVELYEATGQFENAAEWNQTLAELNKAAGRKKAAGSQP